MSTSCATGSTASRTSHRSCRCPPARSSGERRALQDSSSAPPRACRKCSTCFPARAVSSPRAMTTAGAAQVRPDFNITFVVDDPDAVDNVKQRVISLIRRAHGLKKDDPNDFQVQASDSIAKTFAQITGMVTLVVGIGIMNIMLVSVTERTREIGIAKALGAPRRFILLQFLIEAMVLAVIGGLIGMLFGFGLAYGVAALIPNFPSPSVPWWAVVGSALFSMLIGMVFGILPASKAANLAPIDALRYE